MRILLVGSGGVGDAFARIAARRSFFETVVVSDYDRARAERTVAAVTGGGGTERRFVAAQVDASSADAVTALAREHGITHVMNAVDPRFVMPIFDGAFPAGADYLDMAMSLSQPPPRARPTRRPASSWATSSSPWPRNGSRPGGWPWSAWASSRDCPTCSPATPPTTSSARSTSSALRDGSNLVVAGYDFAPSFSIWTTIEECLNPPVIWEEDRGWFVTEPFSEPEVFDFPGGIGPVECVNVEHEEVLLMPRWVEAKRVTFKYGLGDRVHRRAEDAAQARAWTAPTPSR